jgi:hypothetical protein
VAEAPDRVLQPRDLLLLRDVRLALPLELELACDRVGAVAAGPDADPPAVELGDRADAGVEQVTVVRDHHDRAVEVVDDPLELVPAPHVEVRLGLVEHQHLRAAGEAGGKRGELALAAAQLLGRSVVGHAELVEQPARLGLGAVTAVLGPARQQSLLVGQRAAHGVEVGGQARVGQPALDGSQLGLQLGQLGPRGASPGERRPLVAGHVLGQERVHEPAAARHGPAVGLLDAGEDRQHRRLAAAVRSQHPDPHAVGELEVEPVEDPATAEGLDEAAGREERDGRHRGG